MVDADRDISGAAQETGGNRVEQLANNFAAAVLMPSASLRRFGGWADLAEQELIRRLNAAADELHVPSSALRWRLVALGELKQAAARALPEAALRNNGRAEADDVVAPARFSQPFMDVMGLAIDQGLVSVRRMAGLLDVTVEGLAELFASHGFERNRVAGRRRCGQKKAGHASLRRSGG